MAGMGDKPKKRGRKTSVVRFRCHDDEAAWLRQQAIDDGFDGNVSAWLMWQIRKMKREREEKK